MTEDDITVLVDAFTDIKVDVKAIHLALEQNNIPAETIQNPRSEVDEKAVRDDVREKLIPALFS